MVSRLVLMSVNMDSSLLVNWYPHSVFSFTNRLRSASSDTCPSMITTDATQYQHAALLPQTLTFAPVTIHV